MRTGSLFCMMAVLIGGLTQARDAAAQSVDELAGEVRDLESRISQMESRYLKPAQLASKYKAEARFNDARVAYFMGDYNRASVLLVDLVNNPQFQKTESYREALYLLGDVLYKVRNYLAAERYLLRLVKLGPGAYFQEAARTLLELAYQTKDFELVDEVQTMLSGTDVGPALAYASGKALYETGEFARAVDAFRRAAQSPEYNVIAGYFEGVAHAAEGELDRAKQIFTDLAQNTRAQNERESQVIDLAWIALGRIAYEQGDVETAIDSYSRLKRTSEHFDRSLWELTWVLVSKEMYKEARRNVDLLLMSDPDLTFVPEAKILRADLSLRMKEYDDARENYREVIDTFEPAKEEMDDLVAEQDDLQVFFGTLVQEELAGAEPSYMPAIVSRWIQEDTVMQSAAELIEDVRDVNLDVDDTMRMLDEIQARLQSGTRVQSFPELAEGMSMGIHAEARLIEIRKRLVESEYEALEPRLDAAARKKWKSIQANLADLEKRFEQMPQTRDELAKRERAVLAELDRLRRQLDMVGHQIDAQQAQLNAVNTYVEEDYGRELTKAEMRQVLQLQENARSNIRQLQNMRDDLQHELSMVRQSVGIGDPVVQAERQLRQQFRDELTEARTFLDQYRSQASGQTASQLRRIQEARAQIEPVESRLRDYFARMNELIDEKVVELQEDIETERTLIKSHQESIRQLITASQHGAGVLAYLNFMRTRSEFNDLVLRGDVGLTDVSWNKKEEVTTKINQLFQDRTSQLRLLEEAFQEVR